MRVQHGLSLGANAFRQAADQHLMDYERYVDEGDFDMAERALEAALRAEQKSISAANGGEA